MHYVIFYQQGLKSIISSDLASPGGTKKDILEARIMIRHDASSSHLKAKSPASKETELF